MAANCWKEAASWRPRRWKRDTSAFGGRRRGRTAEAAPQQLENFRGRYREATDRQCDQQYRYGGDDGGKVNGGSTGRMIQARLNRRWWRRGLISGVPYYLAQLADIVAGHLARVVAKQFFLAEAQQGLHRRIEVGASQHGEVELLAGDR